MMQTVGHRSNDDDSNINL